MRRSAHAHTSKNDSLRGWLCFKSNKPEVLTTPAGLPSRLLAHEWSHVATMQGHTVKWRALMTLLGHKSDADKYAQRVASRARWIALDPPVHMTERHLLPEPPAGFEVDHLYTTETVVIDGVERATMGGGKYGFVIKYRFVPKSGGA
jgi:hypothetical protein